MSVYSDALRSCTEATSSLFDIINGINFRNKGKVRGTILKQCDIERLNEVHNNLKRIINTILPQLELNLIQSQKELHINKGKIEVYGQVVDKYIQLIEKCYIDYNQNKKPEIANYLLTETRQIESSKLKELDFPLQELSL